MKQHLMIFIFVFGALSLGCDADFQSSDTQHATEGGGLASAQKALTNGHAHPHDHGGCSKNVNIKRTLYHEMGHVKWNRLDSYQQQVWTEVWQLMIDLGLQPNEPYNDNGECKNYFEKNAMEGFCVAYSFIKTNENVDSTITNFFNSL